MQSTELELCTMVSSELRLGGLDEDEEDEEDDDDEGDECSEE